MKRIMLILILSLIIFQACKKSETAEQPPVTVLDYMPLAVGNYWIYENSRCDSGEINCESPFSIDTNTVTKDTVISGNTYFKIEGPHMYWKTPRFYRDSSDCIVDSDGEVIFTINQENQTYNNTEVINKTDTVFYWYFRLSDKPEDVAVKAGNYECYDFRGSLFRQKENFEVEHNMHHLFSKDVGLVRETALFASNVSVTKRELVGYFIQPKSDIVP